MVSLSSTYYLRAHSLDIALDFTIGTCRLATSRYLPSLADATMYARGAPLLGDDLLDGWTFGSGDGAEGLTSGVVTKREESPPRIRATQEEIYPKAVFEDHVDHCFSNHGRRTGLDLEKCPAIY